MPTSTRSYFVRPKHEHEPEPEPAPKTGRPDERYAPAAAPPAPTPPAPDARDEKMARMVEANHKLGDEVNRLKAENESLNKLKNALEEIGAAHQEVGARLQAAISKSN
jgi:hypothetical protein